MTFVDPRNTLIPKMPFSRFLSKFWVSMTAGPQGVSPRCMWGGGGRQLSPFGRGGASAQEGSIDRLPTTLITCPPP